MSKIHIYIQIKDYKNILNTVISLKHSEDKKYLRQ